MKNTDSPLSNSAAVSHLITQIMNVNIFILNLTSVRQYIIDDTDEVHDDFLIINDER